MIHSSIQLDSTLTCGLWSAAMAVSLQRLGLERQTLTKSNAALLETGTCLLFLLPFFSPPLLLFTCEKRGRKEGWKGKGKRKTKNACQKE